MCNPFFEPTCVDFNAPGTVFLICISDLGIVVTLVTLVETGALLTTASAPLPILVGVVAHLITCPAPSVNPVVTNVSAKFLTLLLA